MQHIVDIVKFINMTCTVFLKNEMKTSFLDESLYTVEPRYNEVLGTMKITLLYQVSLYIRVNKKYIYIKSWDQQNCLVIRGFC